jgi:anti-anti-sigma factor
MGRERITAEQAFNVLRHSSQHLNVKLRAVAQRLVDTGEKPEMPEAASLLADWSAARYGRTTSLLGATPTTARSCSCLRRTPLPRAPSRQEESTAMATAWKSSAWVDVSDEAEALVLRLSGELDLTSAPPVEAVITAALGSCPAVTLDLSALTFCDSSGIAMFLRARAEAKGTTMELCRVPDSVARTFACAGVDLVLPIARPTDGAARSS